jgi:hypothetical protein
MLCRPRLALHSGKARHAARPFAAADVQLAALGAHRSPAEDVEHTSWVRRARDRLSETAFEQGCPSGRAMTLDEPIACALNEA